MIPYHGFHPVRHGLDQDEAEAELVALLLRLAAAHAGEGVDEGVPGLVGVGGAVPAVAGLAVAAAAVAPTCME